MFIILKKIIIITIIIDKYLLTAHWIKIKKKQIVVFSINWVWSNQSFVQLHFIK